MSGIKYEVLTGDDLISALRGGRTGDLLDDAAYAAADEIERLQDQNSSLLATNYDLRKERDRLIDELAAARKWIEANPPVHCGRCDGDPDYTECSCGRENLLTGISHE